MPEGTRPVYNLRELQREMLRKHMPDKYIEVALRITPTTATIRPMCPDCESALEQIAQEYVCGCGYTMSPDEYEETMTKAGEWMSAQGYGIKG